MTGHGELRESAIATISDFMTACTLRLTELPLQVVSHCTFITATIFVW